MLSSETSRVDRSGFARALTLGTVQLAVTYRDRGYVSAATVLFIAARTMVFLHKNRPRLLCATAS